MFRFVALTRSLPDYAEWGLLPPRTIARFCEAGAAGTRQGQAFGALRSEP
jgi:hypothetical protein